LSQEIELVEERSDKSNVRDSPAWKTASDHRAEFLLAIPVPDLKKIAIVPQMMMFDSILLVEPS